MFHYLSGNIEEVTASRAVLDVQGVGYELNISANAARRLVAGKKAKLYAYLAVAQDGITLCGFYSAEEKAMFLKLIAVSGIGPKAALQVLGGMELSALALAIVSGDVKALAKIKGVGKKTAERMVLELKEKLGGAEGGVAEGDTGAFALPVADRDTEDAVEALGTLGIGRQEAYQAVAKAKPQSRTIEELIQNALRVLGS